MDPKRIFKLYGHCKLVEGINGLCIYDLINGDIVELEDRFQDVFKRYLDTQALSATDNFDIINELVHSNLGFLTYQNNIYIDDVDFSHSPMFESLLMPNYTISNIFLELTNKCNLNCLFCSEENKIYRSTGCKKYDYNITNFREVDYESVVMQAKMLDVTRVIIIGGEPLLEKKKLENILNLCSGLDLTPVVYSNGSISFTDVIKDLLIKTDGKVVIQSLFNNDEDYAMFTGVNGVWSKQKSNVDSLLGKGIRVRIIVPLGRFNDTMENTAINYFSAKKIPVTVQYIMPYPENNFYSVKLKDDMLDRSKFLDRVNPLIYYRHKKQQFCFSNMLAISYNGDIYACPSLRDFPLGKVSTHKLREIFDNETYSKLAGLSKDKIKGCSNCKFRYGCTVCRALEYYATGDIRGMKNCNVLGE